MIIKHQDLLFSLRKKLYALYILTGQDPYLLNEAALLIKKAWRQQGESDEQIIQLEQPADWNTLQEEANSYCLFSQFLLLDARFDKKSIDASAKKILQDYLLDTNPRSLILLRAPNVPSKQLQFIANNEHTILVQAYPLSNLALQRWVATQLTSKNFRYEPSIPALICQYTQGNMLACAQMIEKLALIHAENDILTTSMVTEQLSDQCNYQLYELAEACLNAKSDKAIHLLRQAHDNKTEPSLILWLLSQEIRLLIQLSHLRQQSIPFLTACNQLKIWPQRAKTYEMALARLPITQLYQLLSTGQQLDEQIKTNQTIAIWYGLEQLAMGLGALSLRIA
jgi:DNA polymerase-3 subunit delta